MENVYSVVCYKIRIQNSNMIKLSSPHPHSNLSLFAIKVVEALFQNLILSVSLKKNSFILAEFQDLFLM